MKNLILNSDLYQDIDSIAEIIKAMTFEAAALGKELPNFNYIPQGLTDFFNMIVGDQAKIEIQSNTGLFRKSNSLIHFENFYQHSLWTVIVAFEPTTLKIHKHKETGIKTFFDVKEDLESFAVNNVTATDKWDTITQINMERNEFVFIRPWVWHSLEQDKLVQIFMLNQKLDLTEEQ